MYYVFANHFSHLFLQEDSYRKKSGRGSYEHFRINMAQAQCPEALKIFNSQASVLQEVWKWANKTFRHLTWRPCIQRNKRITPLLPERLPSCKMWHHQHVYVFSSGDSPASTNCFGAEAGESRLEEAFAYQIADFRVQGLPRAMSRGLPPSLLVACPGEVLTSSVRPFVALCCREPRPNVVENTLTEPVMSLLTSIPDPAASKSY